MEDYSCLLHRKVRKKFGRKFYWGAVESIHVEEEKKRAFTVATVRFEDDDSEEYFLPQDDKLLKTIMRAAEEDAPAPKKRPRRGATSTASGGGTTTMRNTRRSASASAGGGGAEGVAEMEDVERGRGIKKAGEEGDKAEEKEGLARHDDDMDVGGAPVAAKKRPLMESSPDIKDGDDGSPSARKKAAKMTTTTTTPSAPAPGGGAQGGRGEQDLSALSSSGVSSLLCAALRDRLTPPDLEQLALTVTSEEIDGEVLMSMSEHELVELLNLDAALLPVLRRLILSEEAEEEKEAAAAAAAETARPVTTTTTAAAAASTMQSPKTPAVSLAVPFARGWFPSTSGAAKPSKKKKVADLSAAEAERFVVEAVSGGGGGGVEGCLADADCALLKERLREEEIDGECLAAMSENELRLILGLDDDVVRQRLALAISANDGYDEAQPQRAPAAAPTPVPAPAPIAPAHVLALPLPPGLSHERIPPREVAGWMKLVVQDELGAAGGDGEAVAAAALQHEVGGDALLNLRTPSDVAAALGGDISPAAAEVVACRVGGLCAARHRPGGILPHLPTAETLASPMRVVVLGDTGAGKSTVINSLLGEKKLLPTNGMRACTAAVVELSFNTEAATSSSAAALYAAEVEFLGEHEWDDELRVLCGHLTDGNGVFHAEKPEQDTPAYEAWWRLRSVYGRVAPLEAGRGGKGRLSHHIHIHAAVIRALTRLFYLLSHRLT